MTAERGLTVAVTGAAGYVGGKLVETLDSDDKVARILGFDIRPPSVRAKKLVFDNVDVRNPNLRRRFENVDVVVHLAYVMDPIKDEILMRDVNVNGSQNVFGGAAEAGVRKIVYMSSATVYGAHPDNPVPLTEESPLRANLDFNYPAHKLETEYVVNEFRGDHPEITFTLFRPAVVFGPNVDSAWSHQLEAPVFLGIRGFSPPFQFVHEDDVASALNFAVFADLDGAYNLAADGWLESDEVLQIVGRRRVDISEPGAFSMLGRLWSWGLAEAPAGMIHYVMHPWVVSNKKLTDAGFTCRHGNEEALRDTAERAAAFVRFGRRRVKKRDLAAAAAGLGVVSAVAAARSARSHD
jgi:nucleoside-diphosphate-sugar epimerase